jgi:hypothetical protein
LIGIYARVVARRKARGQGDESELLRSLAVNYSVPRSFVEFGFHPLEYNCAGLAEMGFEGLLIDGEPSTVRLARYLIPAKVQTQCRFLDLHNLDAVTSFRSELGVLSVDVDGIDYWLLKALLPLHPSIIVVEYNASFGLRPITVPYNPRFDRTKEHPTHWYHGASLTALAGLCTDYVLHAVSDAGTNAIFVRRDLGATGDLPEALYKENQLRNRWANNTAAEQWEQIQKLEYINVRGSLGNGVRE